MKDYYAILGLASDATGEAVRTAYRRKALQFHPDRNAAPEASEKFREVQEAYDVLADPGQRFAYDENRRRNLLDKPQETALEIWQHYIEGVLQ
ncbi:DnaJ domain-containing protein [Accumulibacter sp.]|jgi:curved DNA-binding protein CbpA|uniref:DnaJ domain-containing protein n=1 Tax=Accumulibacter sp. TaxID=2053492 RepID=UPI001AC0DBEF|nr:DnaJ domain-containing protein [Accumulibacter sp.]MBN8452131.1 DnaJ domain-containing protein [Accumulibacter sp.]MBO3707783.1 DnaJ domain-containing protein [Candidatus Accumulibacter conexus]